MSIVRAWRVGPVAAAFVALTTLVSPADPPAPKPCEGTLEVHCPKKLSAKGTGAVGTAEFDDTLGVEVHLSPPAAGDDKNKNCDPKKCVVVVTATYIVKEKDKKDGTVKDKAKVEKIELKDWKPDQQQQGGLVIKVNPMGVAAGLEDGKDVTFRVDVFCGRELVVDKTTGDDLSHTCPPVTVGPAPK